MLVALTLGATSGGLFAFVGNSNQPSMAAPAAANTDFNNAAFLIDDNGGYAGGLFAPDGNSQVVYVSAAGDTIAGIASRFGVSAAALASANGMDVNTHLNGGEQLIIPTASGQANPPASSKPIAPPAQTVKDAAAPAHQTTTQPSSTPAKPAANQPTTSSPVQQPAAQTAPALSNGAYTVQTGDTLSGIADKYGVSIADLANANGITNLSQIYSGAKLTIPGKAKPSAGSSAKVSASSPPADTQTVKTAPQTTSAASKYSVQAGDNLSTIAAKYGVSVDTLVNANDLADANTIYEGQNLTIPGTNVTVSKLQPVSQPSSQSKPLPVVNQAHQPAPPAPNISTGSSGAPNDRWIDVNISTQTLTAYEGDTAVFRTAVSTGIASHPTVVGRFNIYVKYVSTLMTGPGYYLPNVPYTMYFYQGYGIHGTYWHHNFGHPMSHGCVNLPTPAAKWMFDWASIGTPVVTHY